jgi:ribosome maturation factor RimP
MPTIQDLIEKLTPVVAEVGLELDDLNLSKAGKYSVLEIALDGDSVDLDKVAEASRIISNYLDETDVMGNKPYTLEVTTRGVDRPLTKPVHWRRNTGRLVEVVLPEGTTLGRIKNLADQTVTLDVNGKIVEFDISVFSDAKIQVEFSRREVEEQS